MADKDKLAQYKNYISFSVAVFIVLGSLSSILGNWVQAKRQRKAILSVALGMGVKIWVDVQIVGCK
jgi:hypothetical protein